MISWRRGDVRVAAIVAIVSILGVLPGCSTPHPPIGSLETWRFQATHVQVDAVNDSGLQGSNDEPYLINVWFRAKIGDVRSIQVGVESSREADARSTAVSEGRELIGQEGAMVRFPGIRVLDEQDIAAGRSDVEVMGMWVWAMESDNIGVSNIVDSILTILRSTLENTFGRAPLPTTPEDLYPILSGNISTLVSVVLSEVANLVTPGLTDDCLGTEFYVAAGVKGLLGELVDLAGLAAPIPHVRIPVVDVPTDILGGRIMATAHNTFIHQRSFEVPEDEPGRHTYEFSWIRE